MFRRLKLRLQDMRTLSKLIAGADDEANKLGEKEPGAEHFLLSALKLPDGTARKAFERIGKNPDDFQQAITQQYTEALNHLGIRSDLLEDKPEKITQNQLLHHSKPSGQLLVKQLHKLKKQDKDFPLLSAHVVQVIADMKHGVASRSLKAMGIESKTLQITAEEELKRFHRS